MKKHVLASVFLILISVYSFGQITLGTNDFPKSGKIYNLSTALPFSGMDATITGPNTTWDYSQLSTTRIGARVDTFITVAQTASLYALYFAFGAHFSNHATSGIDFSLGTFISVTNAYNFFNNNSSGYNQTGFGANVNSIPSPIGYTPLDVVYKYPVNYGNIDSCAPAYSISIPGLIYYGVNMTRKNEVDGWGTLTTPFGTFSALRLKSTINETDTFYLDSLNFGFGGIKRPTRTEYKWLGAGKGEPLLQINMTGLLVTSIAYLDSVRLIGVPTQEMFSPDLNIYPNPAKDNVIVQFTLPVAADVKIDIIDVLGNSIASSENHNQGPGDHFMVLNLPATIPSSANYFVRMICNGHPVVRPLVISR